MAPKTDIVPAGRPPGRPPPRPSIETLLATTGTIESLALMRLELSQALRSGEIAPSTKTVRGWVETIFVRVLELMAQQPENAPYIYNVTLTWRKPPGMEEAFRAQMELVTAALPSEAERRRHPEGPK